MWVECLQRAALHQTFFAESHSVLQHPVGRLVRSPPQPAEEEPETDPAGAQGSWAGCAPGRPGPTFFVTGPPSVTSSKEMNGTI